MFELDQVVFHSVQHRAYAFWAGFLNSERYKHICEENGSEIIQFTLQIRKKKKTKDLAFAVALAQWIIIFLILHIFKYTVK